ncbi:isochorismatase family protein [Pseudonocardia bannensis]|uniref:Isochorismatase family protein n=1 Tax=Pseudonocardia bannensis TaxID=630973 RepID=A0A848DH57_9PSEU|nr:isochorismatase family protein [Pseudonocardia bannensis]NMH92010.1 isochorismatase family protein [Pseudonocardia bannensis]
MDQQTSAVYTRAGFGQPVRLGTRPAVLVVDLIYGFTDPGCVLGADLTEQVQATRQVLDEARARGCPVVFTTIQYESNLRDCGLWLQKLPGLAVLQAGRREVEVDARLGRAAEETVIVKKGPSAFFGTNLASVLISQQVDTVVLCGASTSGCIRATAIDLLQYGFPTLVPRECVGDRAQTPHEANLVDIDAKYANVTSLQNALQYLGAVATPAGSAAL